MFNSAPITWFTEDPTTIFISGGFALVVLLVMLLKTGRGVILLAMAGVALCMGLAVLIDGLVVTDREAVEITLHQAAAAAEQNNLDAVVVFISPSAPELKADARHWIGQVILEAVNLRGLDVTIDRQTAPPTATARFWYLAKGRWRRGDTVHENVAGRLTVQLRRDGDRWLVTDYERY